MILLNYLELGPPADIALDIYENGVAAGDSAVAFKLFCIWNMGYKIRYFWAEDIGQALKIAKDVKHCMRGHRRWRDESEHGPLEIPGNTAEFQRMLEQYDKPGVAVLDPERGWTVAGKPTWETAT